MFDLGEDLGVEASGSLPISSAISYGDTSTTGARIVQTGDLWVLAEDVSSWPIYHIDGPVDASPGSATLAGVMNGTESDFYPGLGRVGGFRPSIAFPPRFDGSLIEATHVFPGASLDDLGLPVGNTTTWDLLSAKDGKPLAGGLITIETAEAPPEEELVRAFTSMPCALNFMRERHELNHGPLLDRTH